MDNYYPPTQKKLLYEARAAGEVIKVNGKEQMTEERWQAEKMKDVHKFIADQNKDVAHQA